MADQEKKPSVHTGHRQRMKAEAIKRDYDLTGMPDHRILGLLLFYAIPRGDVNPLAHRLVDHFGSLVGVFHASTEQLLAVPGIGQHTASLIRLVMEISGRYLQEFYSFEGQIVALRQLEDYLTPMFFGARAELAYLVCMDGKNKVLGCKKLSEGVADAVNITLRKILEAALTCNATRVVLAHNHMSGVALPSDSDIITTLRLKRLLREADVELVDHLIFAGGDMVSMAESGLLREDGE